MSSSPKLAGVQAFEYQAPGEFEGGLTEANEGRATTQARQSQEELELKLAAARADGIREGLLQAQQSFEQQLTTQRAQVVEATRAFAQKTNDYFSRAEIELVHLSLAIAAKILHREAQVDRMLVAALVKVAMEKLQHGTTAFIRVHPEEVADWNRCFEGNSTGEIRVEVKADLSVATHDCILETELGTTQLGLDAQLKEIEQGFFDLLAQRPDQK